MTEHSVNRCGVTWVEKEPNQSHPIGHMYWSFKNCTKNQAKGKYKYYSGFSEESQCMGGCGSKPAFDLLRGMKGVKMKRGYTMYKGHVSFEVYTKTKNDMRNALEKLHIVYHWINKEMHFTEHNPEGYNI